MNNVHTAVVVGVGPGDGLSSALTFAAREAERRSVPLRIVHATGIPGQGTVLSPSSSMLEQLRRDGRAVLDDVHRALRAQGSRAEVDDVLHVSDAVDALMHEALTAGVLVLGADDVPWPERMLGGAVAAYVARHAPCPVVVVPQRTSPTPLFGGVVIALDGRGAATGPLRFAFEEAALRDGRLRALHATEVSVITEDPGRAQADLGEVLAGWTEEFPDVHVQRHLALDPPDEACLRATETAELLVMGRPDGRGLPVRWSRGTALEVLRRAWCPVAVVPADYRGS